MTRASLSLVIACLLLLGCTRPGPVEGVLVRPSPGASPRPDATVAEAPKPTAEPPAPKLKGPPALPAGTLVVGLPSEGESLDPAQPAPPGWRVMMDQMFEPLIELGPDGQALPLLAESWEQLDPRTLRLKMRPGVKFWNGEDLTSESVQVTYQRVAATQPPLPQAALLAPVTRVRPVDLALLELSLREPTPDLARRLAGVPIGPKRYLEERGLEAFSQEPLGTGPYRFGEWKRGTHVVLEVHERHWRGEPRIKRVAWQLFPSAPSLVAAVSGGEVDVALGLPSEAARLPGVRELVVSENEKLLAFVGPRVQWMPRQTGRLQLSDAVWR